MTAEPLWRGKTKSPGWGGDQSYIAPPLLDCAEDTEVEVWPAGDRTCPYVETGDEGTSYCRLAEAGDRPTREQVERAMRSWLVRSGVVTFNWRDEDEAVQGATDAVWELLHGHGDDS